MRSPAREGTARAGEECRIRQKLSGDEAMHCEAPGVEALVIGVPLGCGINPALMQAKARAALALPRRAHPFRRVGSAGFAGATRAFFGCLHNNKCNMLLLL